MSRWVLVFLVFTFFIFAPTVVFVCGNVLDTMSGSETCLAQVLANQEVLQRPLPTVQMDLPVGLLMAAGVIWLAAATNAPSLLPSPFTLLPIKPPPR
ncbi:MAG: hypothetical protein IPL78_27890 [Chloroflexi bacterium]|nr:hypothetical protein [Chloroflexota bacterium]